VVWQLGVDRYGSRALLTVSFKPVQASSSQFATMVSQHEMQVPCLLVANHQRALCIG
jgi:hypothetical protein